MPKKMIAACIQMNTQGDIHANIAQAETLMREAHAAGASYLALPENAFFMRGDDAHAPVDYRMHDHPGLLRCQTLARELKSWVLIGSIFVALDDAFGDDIGKWANRSVLVNPAGEIVKSYDKIHLFDADFGDGDSYRESERFVSGKAARLVDLPFGQLGMAICYDVRFAKLFRDLARCGAVALSIPAAFARRTGEAHWHVLLRARAIETGCYVIAPAQCGTHPGGRETHGHSMIIDPWGQILAEASAQETGFITAEIDPIRVAQIRQQMPVLTHDRDYVLQDYVI